jgi:short-subunit dehydrogenase
MHMTNGLISNHQSQIMRSQKKPGVIINIGSAAGLYPMFFDPIYSATKGI